MANCQSEMAKSYTTMGEAMRLKNGKMVSMDERKKHNVPLIWQRNDGNRRCLVEDIEITKWK